MAEIVGDNFGIFRASVSVEADDDRVFLLVRTENDAPVGSSAAGIGLTAAQVDAVLQALILARIEAFGKAE